MTGPAVGIERSIAEAVEGMKHSLIHRAYREQNEFVVLERFLSSPVIEPCLCEVERLSGDVHRNEVPGHKQGGSVSFYTIPKKFPAILSLHRSPALRALLSRTVDELLVLCPEDDPYACALFYMEPGDHIGFHDVRPTTTAPAIQSWSG